MYKIRVLRDNTTLRDPVWSIAADPLKYIFENWHNANNDYLLSVLRNEKYFYLITDPLDAKWIKTAGEYRTPNRAFNEIDFCSDAERSTPEFKAFYTGSYYSYESFINSIFNDLPEWLKNDYAVKLAKDNLLYSIPLFHARALYWRLFKDIYVIDRIQHKYLFNENFVKADNEIAKQLSYNHFKEVITDHFEVLKRDYETEKSRGIINLIGGIVKTGTLIAGALTGSPAIAGAGQIVGSKISGGNISGIINKKYDVTKFIIWNEPTNTANINGQSAVTHSATIPGKIAGNNNTLLFAGLGLLTIFLISK